MFKVKVNLERFRLNTHFSLVSIRRNITRAMSSKDENHAVDIRRACSKRSRRQRSSLYPDIFRIYVLFDVVRRYFSMQTCVSHTWPPSYSNGRYLYYVFLRRPPRADYLLARRRTYLHVRSPSAPVLPRRPQPEHIHFISWKGAVC